jgi:hypothetical protein
MFWFSLILLLSPLHASDEFSSIQKLDEKLPDFEQFKSNPEQFDRMRDSRKQISKEEKLVSIEEIKKSGTKHGAISTNAYLRHLETNQNIKVTKLIYVKYFNLEDEQGFKYLENKDGSIHWKIRSHSIIPISEEMSLYVPPLKYAPAPNNIKTSPFDKKLSLKPELSVYAGYVRGDFMRDLFEDKKALSGQSFQSGIHFFTHWKSPIKAGAVLNYERATYGLNNNQEAIYSSLSFGPQLKTKDFHLLNQLFRIQTQFRYGPFAKVKNNDQTFKLNSTDLLISIEKPFKNSYGELVFGLFTQTQWLNIKDQKTPVEIKSTNETNKSLGFSISQVFE